MSSDNIRLARMEENLRNLSKSFDDHETEDTNRFEKMFGFMREEFDEIKNNTKETNSKLGTLWDIKNQQLGASIIKKTIAGGVYSCLALIAAFIGVKLGK
jgi:hypothetical protein